MRMIKITRKKSLILFLTLLFLVVPIGSLAADLVKFTSSLNRGSATFNDLGKLTLTTKRCFQNVSLATFPQPYTTPLVFSFTDLAMAHVDGLVFLRGILYQNQTSFPGTYQYTTSSGAVMASLSDNGNLYLKSTLVTSSSCTSPSYQPSIWNDGDVVQDKDNCYNYGNNQITYTYAQPGRASGLGDYLPGISVDIVRNAALSDGLTWVGWNFPGTGYVCSGGAQLIYMAIWPGTDYHWFRRDASGYWSHKPGGGLATDLDYANPPKKITNPSIANTGNYTVNGGYYCTCGNNANAR
jgi:hypothetical protein